MRQRTTFSGTVILDRVREPKTHLVPGYKGTTNRPRTARFSDHPGRGGHRHGGSRNRRHYPLRENRVRAWIDSGLEHASQDPYAIKAVGNLRACASMLPRRCLNGADVRSTTL